MKKRYFVLAMVKTNLELPAGVKIESNSNQSENIKITISKQSLSESKKNQRLNELEIIIEINATDITESMILAKKHADRFCMFLAFFHHAIIEECKVYKSAEVDNKNDIIEYSQFDYEILNNSARRLFQFEKVNLINKKTEEILKRSKKFGSRIERAIYYYQKGISESRMVEQFTNYWIAMECLIPILDLKYPDAVEIRTCEKCGNQEKLKNSSSLKKFFENEMSDSELYSKARKIRVMMLHGVEDFEKVEKDISEIIEIFEVKCAEAIYKILDITYDKNSELADINEGLTFQFFIRLVNCNLINEKGEIEFPEFDINMEITDEKGDLAFHPIIKTKILNKGCGFSGMGWDFYGTCGKDIRKIQLTLLG